MKTLLIVTLFAALCFGIVPQSQPVHAQDPSGGVTTSGGDKTPPPPPPPPSAPTASATGSVESEGDEMTADEALVLWLVALLATL